MLRHDQHHLITAQGGNHRERNAGVAAGRLDKRVAGLDITAPFGTHDHGERRAVLHRACWIVALKFSKQDIAVPAGHTLEPDHGSFTDEIFKRGVHVLLPILSWNYYRMPIADGGRTTPPDEEHVSRGLLAAWTHLPRAAAAREPRLRDCRCCPVRIGGVASQVCAFRPSKVF